MHKDGCNGTSIAGVSMVDVDTDVARGRSKDARVNKGRYEHASRPYTHGRMQKAPDARTLDLRTYIQGSIDPSVPTLTLGALRTPARQPGTLANLLMAFWIHKRLPTYARESSV